MTRPVIAPEVLLEHQADHAHIVLNRPDKLNAIDPPMLRALGEAIAAAEAASTVRAIVLRGSGRTFCAGADLEALTPMLKDRDQYSAFLDAWHSVLAALASCPKPTIAAIHGFALAGGFEIVQACDLVVMADDAQIGDQHANFGLFPAGGSTQRLPRLIGTRRALWLLLSGERIDAAAAERLGLANEVVPADQAIAKASEMAQLLAARSPSNNAAIKHAVAVGADRPLLKALAMERSTVMTQMFSADAQIGIAAFRSRSIPAFGPPPDPGHYEEKTP